MSKAGRVVRGTLAAALMAAASWVAPPAHSEPLGLNLLGFDIGLGGSGKPGGGGGDDGGGGGPVQPTLPGIDWSKF